MPARVAGGRHGDRQVGGRRINYASLLEQRFQAVDGVARAGDRREVLEGLTLRGADISFTFAITLDGFGLTQHEFSGKVDGDQIVGTVKVTPKDQPTQTMAWRARRVERSDYFSRAHRHRDVRAAGRQAAHDAPGIAVDAQLPVTSGLDSRCDQSQRRKVRP